MTTLLNPMPMLGREGEPAQPIRHVAWANRSALTVDPSFHTSDDGAAFSPRRMRGDVTAYTKGGTGLPGAFQPFVFRIIGSRMFLGGRLADGGNPARAALFSSPVQRVPVWSLVPTGIEGPKGTGTAYHTIVEIAANDDYVAAISSFGNVTVSEDGGETFTGYGSMGFTGPDGGVGFANGLAASTWGFVAVAENGQLRTAQDPRGTWTARASQFGDSEINGAISAETLFVVFGADGKISTAPTNGPTSWTARASGTTSTLELGIYTGSRTFIGGLGGTWLESTDGTTWSEPTDNPFKGESARPRSAYMAGTDVMVHWGDGQLSRSEDEESWSEIESPGLVEDWHFASGYTPAP